MALLLKMLTSSKYMKNSKGSMGQMNRKGKEKECGSKQFLSSLNAVSCQTEMMRSRFHTIDTSVKHSVCVRVGAGKPADGKYSLYESAPPTYPRGRRLLTGALSPVQLVKEGSGQQQSKEGDTEQTVVST